MNKYVFSCCLLGLSLVSFARLGAQSFPEIKTLSCTFEQEKRVTVLDETGVSKGVMYYQQPDKLRWEYTSPTPMGFIMSGDRQYAIDATGIHPVEGRVNRLFKMISNLIFTGMGGNLLASDNQFDVTSQTYEDRIEARLTPKRKDMQKMVAYVDVVISTADYLVTGLVMHEVSGDTTTIRFTKRELNKTLDGTLFRP